MLQVLPRTAEKDVLPWQDSGKIELLNSFGKSLRT